MEGSELRRKAGDLLDGRYRLLRRIGVGGRGAVFEARHEEMGRLVAIKFLLEGISDPVSFERFRREARAAGRLNHPNVVVVHDFVRHAGCEPYLVMELCDGGSLADELSRTGKASFRRTVQVVGAVSSALTAAHDVGIVHRDLKPANVLLHGDVVKVADFGLASLSSDEESAPGLTGDHAVGTPHFMSPEQASGLSVDGKSDIYSLGVIAFQMLTGALPFDAPGVLQVLMKHVGEPAPSPRSIAPEIPEAASNAILRCLEKNPANRYESASEFARALSSALIGPRAGTEVQTRPTPALTLIGQKASLPEPGGSEPIGRERQLSAIRTRFEDALGGRGGYVLISGEPGSGKTTLIEAFLARETATRPELLTAVGRCSEHFGGGEAYLPFLEIAGRLLNKLEEGRVSGFLRTLAPTWCRHLPALAGESRNEAPGFVAQERMPREMTDFLAVLSTIRPLILVLEDLHWADASSVDLLAYLARRIGEMRLLVLATYRRSDVEVARHPLRQILRGFSASGSISAEISPQPFSQSEVERFVARELGVTVVDPEIVRFVHKRTEGNPLFVLNVLRHLRSLGAILTDGWLARPARPLSELSEEVPDGINGVILSRLERLDEADQRLLSVASVQGESFDSNLVAAALSLDELEVEDRIDRLCRIHQLVEPAGELELPDGTATSAFRFVHAFYQDALYDSIPPKRKAAWHQAIGLLLNSRHARAAETVAATLAVHFERSRDWPRAIEALERAADAAAGKSPRETGPLLLRAVQLAPRLPAESQLRERTRLLTRLARHLSEAAEIIGDAGLYEQGEKAASEALELDPGGAHVPEAQTTLGLIRLERGENLRALAAFRAVLKAHPAHAPAHSGLAYLYKNTGLWEKCLEEQAEAGKADAAFTHSIPRLSVLIYQDRFEDAHAEIDALLASRPRYSHFNYWKGIVHYYEGKRAESREWIRRGYELDPDNAIARGVLAFSLAHSGDRGEAERLLAQAEPGAQADGTFTYWIAKVRAALGDLEGAVSWVGKAEALGYWNAPWIKRDRALSRLHGLPSFAARLESIEERHEMFRAFVETPASS